MYSLYKVNPGDSGSEYTFYEKTSLVGCNNGILARYLDRTVGPEVSEPYRWEMDLDDAVSAVYPEADTFVIDIKPRSQDYISLFKLEKAWGHSNNSWTPLLLRLRELLHDVPVSEHDKRRFTVEEGEERSVVHSFMYVRGSIIDGEITGTWNFPGPSQTAPLLWQHHFEFFKQHIEEAYA